jgi:hypothetical protein
LPRIAQSPWALPPEARQWTRADIEAAERACPPGLPVVDLLGTAQKHLG